MTLATKIIFIIALIVSIIVPFGYYLLGEKSKKRYKRAIGTNAFFFFGAFAVATIMLLGGPDVQAAESVTADSGFATGLGYLAAALVTGLSCIGGGIAVASAASAALGAISEDSSVLGKSLIFVGLAEGVLPLRTDHLLHDPWKLVIPVSRAERYGLTGSADPPQGTAGRIFLWGGRPS